MIESNELDFYACQGFISDPGDYASLFDELPTDVPDLCRIVQGILIHMHWLERYGVRLTGQRKQESELRFVHKQLHAIKEKDVDPNRFGIFNMWGLWFVRGNLVRDLAALNKMELLPWDCWGLIEGGDQDISDGNNALLDRIAEHTATAGVSHDKLRDVYQKESQLKVPAVIRSYLDDGPKTVDLEDR
ncbi:MAG: hypothetical protein GY866_23070 [Proteobacteria bacterium]|nr:hypothetical protein [Pseudomonadota bacterium]